MSIEGKHSYRFKFLKSDKWKGVRLEALVREKGKCQICGAESVYNDAHHIWYPKNMYDTTEKHLVVLCRSCHNFIHALIPDCKTSDEQQGIEIWSKFRNAILAWRQEKQWLFMMERPVEIPPIKKTSELREAYDTLKRKYREQEAIIHSNTQPMKLPDYAPVQIILPIPPPDDSENVATEKPVKAKELRDAYDILKKRCRALEMQLVDYATKLGTIPPVESYMPPKEAPDEQLETMIGTIRNWAKFYREYS